MSVMTVAEIQQPTVDIFIVIIDQELAAWKSKNVSHMTWQIFVNIFSFILTPQYSSNLVAKETMFLYIS